MNKFGLMITLAIALLPEASFAQMPNCLSDFCLDSVVADKYLTDGGFAAIDGEDACDTFRSYEKDFDGLRLRLGVSLISARSERGTVVTGQIVEINRYIFVPPDDYDAMLSSVEARRVQKDAIKNNVIYKYGPPEKIFNDEDDYLFYHYPEDKAVSVYFQNYNNRHKGFTIQEDISSEDALGTLIFVSSKCDSSNGKSPVGSIIPD